MANAHFTKLSSVTAVLNMNKAGPSGRADLMLQRLNAEAHPYFYSYSCNWDQMGPTVSDDPRTVSVKTSVSVSETISFSTFRTSVESLLEQWPTSGSWRHNWPANRMRRVVSFVHFAKLLRTTRLSMFFGREDLTKTSRSLDEVAKVTSPSDSRNRLKGVVCSVNNARPYHTEPWGTSERSGEDSAGSWSVEKAHYSLLLTERYVWHSSLSRWNCGH